MRSRMILLLFMISTVVAAQWNNPHETTTNSNVRYSPFQGQPKTLIRQKPILLMPISSLLNLRTTVAV